MDATGQQNTRVILLHPSAQVLFRANVNVTVQELRGLTSEEFLTLSRLQLKQLTGLPRADRDEPAHRPDGGHALQWSMPLGPIAINARQLIVMADSKAYVVTTTAPAGEVWQYQPAFDIVFNSFQLQLTA